jgi:hypothetical protein
MTFRNGLQEIIQEKAMTFSPFEKRKIDIYLSPQNQGSNALRKIIMDTLQRERYGDALNIFVEPNSTKMTFSEYLDRLLDSKFVLSPPGNGIDCYRTWEILAMGAVPIVIGSNLNPLYQLNPVIMLNEWHHLKNEQILAHVSQIVKRKSLLR